MSKEENTSNSSNSSSESDIKVVCRFRPQNEKELALKEGGRINYDFSPDGMSVYVKTDSQKFTFDRVFEMKTTQEEVYSYAAKPVILQVIEGYNGTIFAYGQTSAGKTHTMEGPDYNDKEKRGIIPRMIDTLFETIYSANQNIEFTVQVSMLEIYNEKIRDLLDPTRLDLKVHESREKGVYVGNASDYYVSSPDDIFNLLKIGTTNRSVGATNMNKFSSRSHSIFVITISQRNLETLSRKSGRLYLVDLAGSEKIQKTGAEGSRLDEAKNINKSLFTLGSVINALTDGKSTHIPYRDSQLTRILQEALGGNSKTALILNCSPAKYNEEETVSTLRFGIRAKRIKNKAVINAEKSAAELKMELAAALKEIEILKRQLLSEGKEIGDIKNVINSDINQDEFEKLKQKYEDALEDVDELQRQVDDSNNKYGEIIKEFRDEYLNHVEEIESIQHFYREHAKAIELKCNFLKERNHALKNFAREIKEKHPEEVPIELSDSENSDSSSFMSERSDEEESSGIKIAGSEDSMKERTSEEEDNENENDDKVGEMVKLTEQSLSEMNIENLPAVPSVKSDLSIPASNCATTATSEVGSENPTEVSSPTSTAMSETKKIDSVDSKIDENSSQSTLGRNRVVSGSMSRRGSIAALEDGSKSDQLKDKMKLLELKKQIKDYELQINTLNEGLTTYQVDYETLKIEHEDMKKKYENTVKLLSNEKDLNSQLEEQITKIGQSLLNSSSDTENAAESLQQMTELCRAQETMILKLKDEIEQYKSVKEELLSETSSLKLQLLVDSDNTLMGNNNNNVNNNNNNNRNREDSCISSTNENLVEQYNEITMEFKILSEKFASTEERMKDYEARNKQLQERNEVLTNLLKRKEEKKENNEKEDESDVDEEYTEAYLSLMNDVVLREQQIQTLQDNLHNRCDRVVQLELQLDACKEQIQMFDQAYMQQSSQKIMKDKIKKLELKLKEKDQQLSKMTMTLHLNEKKMTSLNDKVKELEKKVNSGTSSTGFRFPTSVSTIRGGATINAIKGGGGATATAAGSGNQVVPIRGGLRSMFKM